VLRTLHTASEAMHRDQTRIDTLANNLANAATTGFRQVLTRVAETAAGDRAGDAAATPAAAPLPAGGTGWVAARELDMTQALDTRPGPLTPTGRAADIALSGRGFLVVLDPEAGELFTRDGALRLDEAGQLVTGSGLPVQGEGGPIVASGGALAIAADGTVTVDGQARGRLRVVDFDAPHRLLPRGDGLLTAPDDLAATPLEPAQVSVVQGHLEGSNVDPVRTLVDMIAAQRAFEIGSKVLQANDEMLGKSVNSFRAG